MTKEKGRGASSGHFAGGIDLLRILARFERRGIAVGELIDGEVESTALAVLIAVDRTGDAFVALGREQLVAQRLAADIESALVVGLANLLDRLGEDRRRRHRPGHGRR